MGILGRRSVDDFVVQRGASAKKLVDNSEISDLNSILENLGLRDLEFEFLNIPDETSMSNVPGLFKHRTSGLAIGSRTNLAVVSNEFYNAQEGISTLHYAHHFGGVDKRDTALIDYLKKEKISLVGQEDFKLGGRRNLIFIGTNVVEEGSDELLHTTLHEIGHSASSISTAYGERVKAIDFFESAFKQFSDQKSNPTSNIGKQFNSLVSSYVDVMRKIALEEGRAETFSLELIQRGIGLGTISEQEPRLSSYSSPIAYQNYGRKYLGKIKEAIRNT